MRATYNQSLDLNQGRNFGGIPFSTKRGTPKLRVGNFGPTCVVRRDAPERAMHWKPCQRYELALLCSALKVDPPPGFYTSAHVAGCIEHIAEKCRQLFLDFFLCSFLELCEQFGKSFLVSLLFFRLPSSASNRITFWGNLSQGRNNSPRTYGCLTISSMFQTSL